MYLSVRLAAPADANRYALHFHDNESPTRLNYALWSVSTFVRARTGAIRDMKRKPKQRRFLMNVIRTLSAVLAISCLVIGSLMSGRNEQSFGHTLVLAGAIIIAGLLISSAIVEKGRKE